MFILWANNYLMSTTKTLEQGKWMLTVCYYHVTYEFQSESTLYSLPECQETQTVVLVSFCWIWTGLLPLYTGRYESFKFRTFKLL